jgi:hypothetical protein
MPNARELPLHATSVQTEKGFKRYGVINDGKRQRLIARRKVLQAGRAWRFCKGQVRADLLLSPPVGCAVGMACG